MSPILYEPVIHHCPKPLVATYETGTVWQCEECGQSYQLTRFEGYPSWDCISERRKNKILKAVAKTERDTA